MKRKFIYLLSGTFLGLIASILIISFSLPKLMLQVNSSSLGFDETVATIKSVSKEEGWKTPKAYDLQKTFLKLGYSDVNKMLVMSLCQPHHAAALLKDDLSKPIMAMMPCRVAIYETNDGQVYISQLNSLLLSRLFGGDIQTIMHQAATEINNIVRKVI